MKGLAENRRRIAAVFLSNMCAAIAFAILSPTLVANLSQWHTSALSIAVITSVWALPNVLGGPLYTRLAARFNPRVCLLVGVACSVATLLLFPVLPDVRIWIVLQLVNGAVLGHFYLVTEAWLNHFTEEALRARVTAIYGILPAIGYAIGAGIYTLVGFRGSAPFIAAAAAMAVGLVPLLLLRGSGGDVIIGGEKRLWTTARLMPLLLSIAVIAGMLETVPWGVYQVYALKNGFSVQTAGWFLPTFFAGEILLTYPIGWAADRVGRRALLMWVGALSVALMAAMYLWGRTFAVWGIVFATGGIFNAVYTLGLALLGQRFQAKALVSASAAFMTTYSIGAVGGPPLVGALMDAFGARSLPLVLGGVAAIVAFCALDDSGLDRRGTSDGYMNRVVLGAVVLVGFVSVRGELEAQG
jgi:MFS family permease